MGSYISSHDMILKHKVIHKLSAKGKKHIIVLSIIQVVYIHYKLSKRVLCYPQKGVQSREVRVRLTDLLLLHS